MMERKPATDKLFTAVTKKQNTEFGLLAILLVLLRAHFVPGKILVETAFVLTVLTIILPLVFYPFAFVWFGLSRLLNRISSAVLMGGVFLLVVLPIGLLRRWMGADPLKIRKFKKGRESVMISRDHLFTRKDLENTF